MNPSITSSSSSEIIGGDPTSDIFNEVWGEELWERLEELRGGRGEEDIFGGTNPDWLGEDTRERGGEDGIFEGSGSVLSESSSAGIDTLNRFYEWEFSWVTEVKKQRLPLVHLLAAIARHRRLELLMDDFWAMDWFHMIHFELCASHLIQAEDEIGKHCDNTHWPNMEVVTKLHFVVLQFEMVAADSQIC